MGAIRLDNFSGSLNYNAGVSAGNTLTLNGNNDYSGSYLSGLVLNSAAGGSLTIAADVVVASSQRWVSSRTLDVTGNVDLGSNTLSLFAAGQTTTLSGTISGSGGISRTDSAGGTAVLSNVANTYSGVTRLVSGVLSAVKITTGGAASSIGNSSNSAGNLVFNGGTLNYIGVGDTTDRGFTMQANGGISASGAGAFTWASASPTFVTANTALTLTLGGSSTAANSWNTVLPNNGTGALALQKAGAGLWLVTVSQSYTGATIVQQGTLRVGGTNVLGGIAGSVADTGNIWFTSGNANGALEFETAANLGPADQVRFSNTGGTAGSGGALRYIGTTDQAVSKTLFCNTSIGMRLESDSVGGRLLVNGAFSQSNRPLLLGGSGTGANELATAFAGTGSLTKRGAGRWVLTAANTYTGTTGIEAGTLQIGNGSTSGTIASTTALILTAGAELAFNRSDNITVSNTLSGVGTVTKAGAGVMTVSGPNAGGVLNWNFSGTGNGSISFANANAVGGAGSTITVGASGSGKAFFSGSGNSSGVGITIGNGGAFTWDGSTSNTTTLSGVVAGSGTFTKISGETLILTGTSTHTGPLTIGSGTLRLANAGLLGGGTYGGAITNSSALLIATSANQTFSGPISGSGYLEKSNSGTLTLTGNCTYAGATTVNAGALIVNGTLAGTSGVTIASGASVNGSGKVQAALAGAGWITPGNSAGIMTASAINPTAGMGFSFEFTGTGSPTYANATASVNDVLRLTDSTAFTSNLSSGNVVDIYLGVASILPGDVFRGGFYVDAATNFATSIDGGSFSYWVLGNGGGTDKTYNGQGYYSLANYDPQYSVTRSTVSDTANFASGAVSGGVTQFVVVPEPATTAVGCGGLLAAGWALRRRRRG